MTSSSPATAPVDLMLFLGDAARTASALAQFHQQQPVHGALTPHAVSIDRATGATRIEPPRPQPDVDRWVYASPEHTGRVERPVDARSDLYALGVILYQRLTGSLPFEAHDPLEWVHSHLAKSPKRVTAVVPHAPEVLADVIAKLLAKNPDERYQTAASVAADLDRCVHEWSQRHDLTPFALAANDAADRFLIPLRLYGRQPEVETLLGALRQVAADTQPRLVLLTGESGVGKTALVREMAAPLARAGGLFTSGKFDQLKPDVPHGPIVRAFRQLVTLLLASDEAHLAQWRERLSNAVGKNGQLLVSLLPEVELIVGPQPPVAPMPAHEAHQRFARVMRRFIGVFATEQTPLTLFLDDLQWADAASLKLLEDIATHPSTRSLLLIGAYRDNEVAAEHPLRQALARIEAVTSVQTLPLGPLPAEALGRLVADTLHTSVADSEPLLTLLTAKTGGNPLFFTRQLTALYRARVIRFDHAAHAWSWSTDDLRAQAFTDNVIDLLTRQLAAYPHPTQRVLGLAACLGNGFDAPTLASISGLPLDETTHLLRQAANEGLILQTPEGYRFLHDRIQQAAVSLIAPERREATHLTIGRVLLARLTEESAPERVFEAVSQLNRVSPALMAADERERVALLNLVAAKHARATAAFHAAADYAGAGLRALGPTAQTPLAFSLCLLGGDSALAVGDVAGAAERLAQARTLALTRADQAGCWRLQIDLDTRRGESVASLTAAFECLKLYGVELSLHPSTDEVDAFEQRLRARITDSPITTLTALPLAQEPDVETAVSALVGILPSAYYVDPNLHRLVACTIIDFALEHGLCPLSPMGFAAYALELAIRRELSGIEAYLHVARHLVERHGFTASKAMVLNLSANCTMWTQDARAATSFAREGQRVGVENGDLLHAALCAMHPAIFSLTTGAPLDEMAAEGRASTAFIHATGYEPLALCSEVVERVALALQGQPGAELSGRDFESVRERGRTSPIPTLSAIVAMAEMFGLVLLGDVAAALAIVDRERPRLMVARGQAPEGAFSFFAAVATAQAFSTFDARERPKRLAELKSDEARLHQYAQGSPANHSHQALLVAAVVADLEGRHDDADRQCDAAIAAARKYGAHHVETLAHEFAARCARHRGLGVRCELHLREAYGSAMRWGATAIMRRLEAAWPSIRFGDSGWPRVPGLDSLAVVKASQAISGEIVLERLFEQLLRVVMQEGGAQRGALVLARQDELVLAATGATEGDRLGVTVNTPFAPLSHESVPTSVIHYVKRSLKTVLLSHATQHETFSSDPYIVRHQTQSLLCMPIVRQGALQAVLVLDNNLLSNAFTPERQAVLELLAAQLAISLENALLVADLRHEMAERKRREDELRLSEDKLRQAQKMEAIGLLAGGIAHDFNNLLTVICGYSLLATKQLPQGEVRDDIEEILHAGERAGDLTRQLLAFSRKQVLAPKPLDLNAVVANLDKMLRRLIGENIELVSQYTPTPGVVRADPGQIEQVVVNLVVNARDAMPRGGRLTISTAVVSAAQHPTLADGRWLALTVRDTGEGMAPETQARIFEPFFTTKGQGRGTGLGLSTVYGIVQQSGGQLEVDSALGQGTAFTVLLPQVDGPAEALAEKPSKGPVTGGNETLLLVEDDATVRTLARNVLTRLGYEVLTAADGVEGLEVFTRHGEPIDLLITDTVMPRMNGPELARRLRALAPGIRLVFLSGYASQPASDQETFDLGLFLQKPFTPDALGRLVRAALDQPPRDPRVG